MEQPEQMEQMEQMEQLDLASLLEELLVKYYLKLMEQTITLLGLTTMLKRLSI